MPGRIQGNIFQVRMKDNCQVESRTTSRVDTGHLPGGIQDKFQEDTGKIPGRIQDKFQVGDRTFSTLGHRITFKCDK